MAINEIEHNYSSAKKWGNRKYLNHKIEVEPLSYAKEKVPPKKLNGIFMSFTDELLVLKFATGIREANVFASKLWFGLATLSLMSPYTFYLIKGGEFPEFSLNRISFYFSIFFSLIGLLYLYKNKYVIDYQHVKFHRLLGIVELPYNKRINNFAIYFKDVKALIRSFVTSNYYSGPLLVFVVEWLPFSLWKALKGERDWIAMSWSHDPKVHWSFYVWYMDRNRPLPPGTAFDPYRKKDYERRKAEGFPPPLYESKIPTPEYEPEKSQGEEFPGLGNLN